MEEKDKLNTSKLDIDLGTDDTFFVADNGNYFGVAFDKLFNQPQLDVYNLFEMSSKRNFKNLSPIVLSTYQELFLDEGQRLKEDCEFLFFNLLKIKSSIMVNDSLR